ncbi:MAG: DNA adenine methylase [Candidatus Bathyarchaeota archaeon]|nr:DNA adenine methylase [Candidatus Bathyarchaeota archaeon]MDH5788302.1 DNA adenine methylase [Candidatus Bathyarchaeota archaeon]
MGQRYIGAKTRVVDEILRYIKKVVPAGGTVADLMCGNGSVSLKLRKSGYKVIAVDVLCQAYHITRTKVLLQDPPPFCGAKRYFKGDGQLLLAELSGYGMIVQTLNNLLPVEGYFWREFSPEGKPSNGSTPRKYFSAENAKKIDAVRAFIKKLVEEKAITDIEYSLLIHDLIMASNNIANIAGTYGHYLSKFVPRALQPIEFISTKFERGGLLEGHKIMNGYAEKLAPIIEADLCYIDPPYKKRQYAANYHIPETIARGDEPEAQGKSGLRPWLDQYSDFCSKRKIRSAFETIIANAKSSRFLVSYSSEGLLSRKEMVDAFSKFGDVAVTEFPIKRFKSRNEHASEKVMEYLFYLQREPIVQIPE